MNFRSYSIKVFENTTDTQFSQIFLGKLMASNNKVQNFENLKKCNIVNNYYNSYKKLHEKNYTLLVW